MKKTPLPRILAAALLLFIPLLSLSAAAADVQGAMSYVPNDSFAVLSLDVDAIKTTQVVTQLTNMVFSNEPEAKKKIDQLKKEAGLDIFRDIHAVVLGFGSKFVQDDDQFVLVAEATVDEARLVSFITKEGGKIQSANGPSGKYYELGRKRDGRMAFRGKFVILCGDKVFDDVMKKTGPKPSLTTLWKKNASRNVALAAEVIPELRKDLERKDKSFGQLQTISAGLNVTDGVDLMGLARFATSKPAQTLAQMVNQELGGVKNDKEVQKMGLAKILNGIRIASAGRDLTASVKVTGADLNRLLGLLAKMM